MNKYMKTIIKKTAQPEVRHTLYQELNSDNLQQIKFSSSRALARNLDVRKIKLGIGLILILPKARHRLIYVYEEKAKVTEFQRMGCIENSMGIAGSMENAVKGQRAITEIFISNFQLYFQMSKQKTMAENTKYGMGFEHILFIFQCETENFGRKQMLLIKIFTNSKILN